MKIEIAYSLFLCPILFPYKSIIFISILIGINRNLYVNYFFIEVHRLAYILIMESNLTTKITRFIEMKNHIV